MDWQEMNRLANEQAVEALTQAEPYWVDYVPAGECIEGLTDHMVLHSGPPIAYDDMCGLHKRGMVNASLFEGWAKTPEEAEAMIRSGEIRIDSALNYNTDGSGTGIISRSIGMMVFEDKRSGKRACMFPAEGQFGGGLCGWGLFSKEIAENLRYMRDELLAPMREVLEKAGGIALRPMFEESLRMGDENHSRQTASGWMLNETLLPLVIRSSMPEKNKLAIMDFFVNTPRLFHGLGQGACRTALLAASDIEGSSVVTAAGGNGVTFGIKVSGLGDQWFTAPAPMIVGRFAKPEYSVKDQLPWCGDSSVVECYGMGGIASAASPIVCEMRGVKLQQAIELTRSMQTICAGKNPHFTIPNLDFECLPAGIDVLRVESTGILPEIDGGMINHQGGWIGAGSAKIPAECFQKAADAYRAKYAV